jgi:hypothetical protein
MGIAYELCPSPEAAAETQQLMKTAREVRVRGELSKLINKDHEDGIKADARRLYERRQMT